MLIMSNMLLGVCAMMTKVEETNAFDFKSPDTGSPSRHDTGVDLNKTKKVCKNV